MGKGRIVKISKNSTFVFEKGKISILPFKTKHNLYDIIDQNDNLIAHSHQQIDFESKFQYLKKKFFLISKAKEFFKKNGFEEVLTPKIRPQYLKERNIKKIKTKYGYLVPSFEIEHKKLLCLGFDKIFELNFAYRDDFEDYWHTKEFLMLEWYRAFDNHDYIVNDFKNLCIFLNNSNKILKTNSSSVNLSKFEFFSYEDLFSKHLNLNIRKHFDKSNIILKHNLEPNLTKTQVLDFLFATYIEKKLGKSCISIVYNFSDFTFLAKKEGKFAKRYEFYIDGVELANCYDEENDFARLKKHFNKHTDSEFVNYMAFGMPPASGIAFGFDRMLKLLL